MHRDHDQSTANLASRRGLLRGAVGAAAVTAGAGALWPQVGAAQATAPMVAQQSVPSRGPYCGVAITGVTQGVIQGDGNPAQHLGQEGRIDGLGFHFEAGGVTDERGGIRRQYGPVVLTKAWDRATPRLIQAFATNESLSVLVEFVSPNPVSGENQLDYSVTLEGARILKIEQYLHFNAAGHDEADLPLRLEDVSFSYDTLAVRWEPTSTTAQVAVRAGGR